MVGNHEQKCEQLSAAMERAATTMRIGIVTALAVLPSYPRSALCGLTKWCRGASALRLMLTQTLSLKADVMVLTDDNSFVASECSSPHIRIRGFDTNLYRAVGSWAAKHKKNAHLGSKSLHHEYVRHIQHGRLSKRTQFCCVCHLSQFTKCNLLKWHAVSLIEFDVVLLTDSDIDLFPPPTPLPPLNLPPSAYQPWATYALPAGYVTAAQHVWREQLRDFLSAAGVQLVASADAHSPINTGALLLRPDVRTHALGERVLARGTFNTTHGFDLAGQPRALLRAALPDHATWRKRYWASHMVRDDTWDFVGSNADQGLFSYVYLFLLRGAVRKAHHKRTCPEYRLWHFWGNLKPWRLAAQTMCLPYMQFLDMQGANTSAAMASKSRSTSSDRSTSRCTEWLLARRQAYLRQANANATACRGFNVHCLF